jgi:hypothetical protein
MIGLLFHWFGWFLRWFEDTRDLFVDYWYPETHYRYYLDGGEVEHAETVVPAGKVLVEEWTRGIQKRARLLYEGDAITPYEEDPWVPVLNPWLWIGDQEREIDLTDTLQKYVMPGNFIMYDLLTHYVDHVESVTYLDPRSLSFLKFPVEGIRV